MPGVAPEHVRPALGAVVPRRSGDCSAEADEFVTCAGSSSASAIRMPAWARSL